MAISANIYESRNLKNLANDKGESVKTLASTKVEI